MSAVIVLTYGKVCSSSVQQMLMEHFPGNVFFSHGLRSKTTKLVRSMVGRGLPVGQELISAFEGNDAIERRLTTAARDGETITIVTGTREPVARSLSVAVQTLHTLFPEFVSHDAAATAEGLAAHLGDLWVSRAPSEDVWRELAAGAVRAPFDWFREEIEEPFGFDLRATPFDFERGYTLFVRDNVRILVFRMEDAPRAIEAGLSELFPDRSFALPRVNVTRDKPDNETYQELQQRFTLPEAVLDGIYDDPYVRSFLSAEDVRQAKARWSKPAPRPRATECAGSETSRVTPRAAVFIPVRNNERYVRAALQSVLAQWQPDLELLVLDDGSTDGSFEAVRNFLTEYSDVAATLMRNPRSRGMDSLPHVLQQTRAPIIIQVDSDDIALPGRIKAVLECFEEDPNCRLVTTNAVLLSDTGIPIGVHDKDAVAAIMNEPEHEAARSGSVRWLGATAAYHRAVLETFPALDPELCPYGLDLLLPFRATLLGTHRYLPQPYVGWRQHANNSHKRAGGASSSDMAMERHGAFMLMVQAQKIRDLSALAVGTLPQDRMVQIDATCQRTFHDRFAQWCRIRSRLETVFRAGEAEARTPDHAPPSTVGIPPLVTLRHGERRNFGAVEELGAQVHAWDGFHGPEASWNWTAAAAVVAFRWPESTAGTVTIGMSGGNLPLRRVCLSVNLGMYHVIEVNNGESIVSLPIEAPHPEGVLSLLIHVPDAVRPADTGSSKDERRLGVQLLFIEARRGDDREP